MNKLKKVLSAVGSGIVLSFSMAGFAAADSTNNIANDCLADGRFTVAECNAINTVIDLSGNCRAFIVGVPQTNAGVVAQDQDVDGGDNEGRGDDVNTTDAAQNATVNQGNSFAVSQDCSTTNNNNVTHQHVTHVTQAAASTGVGGSGGGSEVSAVAQVSAVPSGRVNTGAGGAADTSTATSVAGLVSSLGVAGLGLAISRRAFGL